MKKNLHILIVDDEASQRNILGDILTDAGYLVSLAEDGERGLECVYAQNPHIVLTDLKMPGKDGLEVLNETRKFNPDTQVIMMTAFGSIPNAVNAIKNGAYDYLTKPFQKNDLLHVVERAADKCKLLKENQSLRETIKRKFHYHRIIGTSPAMQQIYRMIERVKNIDATVLISGESGTGKELVANAIHESGERNSGPFVAINCGAIPESLIESELFGHEKGAFTGAAQLHPGKFEQAQNGTIFLDEISAMPLSAQVRLLRVLQDRTVERVGGNQSIGLNVRVIAASNENLEEKVSGGEFRLDLFHRINVFNILLPPLRERKGDIVLLAKTFVNDFAEQYGKSVPYLTLDAITKLEQHHYPGNVRELQNIIEKTIILFDGSNITASDLMIPGTKPAEKSASPSPAAIPDMEKDLILQALKKYRGSIKAAAEQLGLSYKTLQYRMKKYGFNKRDFK